MEDAVGAGKGLFVGVHILAVFGAIVGWLAGLSVKGSDFGLAVAIVSPAVGAVILLLIIKIVRRASPYSTSVPLPTPRSKAAMQQSVQY